MKQERVLKMYRTLLVISKDYQTPSQLRKICGKQYGLDYEEALEMAYENIQQAAAEAIKGVRIKTILKKIYK